MKGQSVESRSPFIVRRPEKWFFEKQNLIFLTGQGWLTGRIREISGTNVQVLMICAQPEGRICDECASWCPYLFWGRGDQSEVLCDKDLAFILANPEPIEAKDPRYAVGFQLATELYDQLYYFDMGLEYEPQ